MKQLRLFTGGHKLTADDFIHSQNGVLTNFVNIIKALIPTGFQLTILDGVALTESGGEYTWTEGYVYYNDDFYFLPAQNTPIALGDYSFYTENIAEVSNPVIYRDGTPRNVHITRTLVLQNDLGGAFPATNLATPRKLSEFLVTKLIDETDLGKKLNDDGWKNITIATGVNVVETPQYRKIGDKVELRGIVSRATDGNLFTLPSGNRPTNIRDYAVGHNAGAAPSAISNLQILTSGLTTTQLVASVTADISRVYNLDNIIFWIR